MLKTAPSGATAANSRPRCIAFDIREIRFSAYPGGAIRILFKAAGNTQQAILLGFIKKSDAEGYLQNISEAKVILDKLCG